MPKLTKRVVEAVTPSDKPAYLWDDQLIGFGLKILPGGQRRYIVKYRTHGGGRGAPQRWYTVGTHGGITTDQARDLAQQILAAVARGEDPQGNKFALREAPTLQEVWDRYAAEHLPRKKPGPAKEDKQKWRDFVEKQLSKKRVDDINRDDIENIHKGLSDRPYQANRVIALLSKLLNLAEGWGVRPDGTNPCRHIQKFQEDSRERYLSISELERLGDALREGLDIQEETPYMVAAVKLLLLTGARLNEILTAKWEWVDLERRVVYLPDSKTGKKTLYLSEAAVEVLRGLQALTTTAGNPYVIQGRVKGQPLVNLTKPWARICKRAGLKNVRLHDLRHTAASIGVSQGMNLPVIGRLLGHTQASTTNRYAHVDIDPALAAADKIGNVVSGALGLNGTNKDHGNPLNLNPPIQKAAR